MSLLIIALFFFNQALGNPIPVESSGLANQRHKRIVGGIPMEIDTFPWIASIQRSNIPICAGSILSETIILTAAHCVAKYPPDVLSVRVGSSTVDSGGSKHKVAEIMIHANYKNRYTHSLNDVALLKVSPPLEFNEYVTNVVLSKKKYVAPGTVTTVAGWGRTSEDGRRSRWLRSTSLVIVDSKKCARDYGDFTGAWMSSHGQICTDAPGTDACKGDSGGPLMVDGVQVGIISWGRGCARPESPNVSTNVAVYRDWIHENAVKLEQSQGPVEA